MEISKLNGYDLKDKTARSNISQLTNTVADNLNAQTNINTVLDNKIKALSSGSPAGVYPSLADLISADPDHNKIYVVSDSGKWCYYNNGWVEGGNYQTSVNDNEIENLKTKFSSVFTTDNNLFNPSTAKKDTLINNSGAETSNTNNWCTDYIEIDITKTLYINYIPVRLIEFDENKNFVAYTQPKQIYTEFNPATKYIRFNFANSTISYDNKTNVLVINDLGIDNETNESYFVIDNRNIKNNSISISKFNKNIKNNLIEYSINNNSKIFDENDFAFVNISNNDGKLYGNTRNYLTLKQKILFKKGTYFKTNYKMRLYFYNENDEFISASKNKIDNYNLNNDYYVKIKLFKNDESVITDSEKIEIANDLTINYKGEVLTYEGEKINVNKNICYYKRHTYTKLSQDCALYGDELFSFSDKITHEFKVINLKTGVESRTYNMPIGNDSYPNCNTACFGNLKYNENDEYPLLYVAYWQDGHFNECGVYRIQKSNNDYVATYLYSIFIELNEIDSSNAYTFAIDYDKGYLYAVCTTLNNNKIFKFNIPTEQTTLRDSDVIDYFDVDYRNSDHQAMQYYQGKIYQAGGNENAIANSSNIYVNDIINKKCVSKLYMGSIIAEPQSISFYNNEMHVASRIIQFD